jgi:hypothetical protein
LLLHPTYTAMRNFSGNEGFIWIKNLTSPRDVVILCVLVGVATLAMFTFWLRDKNRDDNIAIKYLTFYSGSLLALCVLQAILLRFGIGSNYAVKKYVYSLVSVLFIDTAILAGYLVSWRGGDRVSWLVAKAEPFHGFILAAVVSGLFLLSLRSPVFLDVSDTVAMERRLLTLRETVIPSPEPGKSNVAIGLGGTNNINYILTLAILKTEFAHAVPDVLINNNFADLNAYSYIVSLATDTRFGSAGCESLSTGILSVVTRQCLEKRR